MKAPLGSVDFESLCRWGTSAGLARHIKCNVFETLTVFVVTPGGSPLRRAIVVVIGEGRHFLIVQYAEFLA